MQINSIGWKPICLPACLLSFYSQMESFYISFTRSSHSLASLLAISQGLSWWDLYHAMPSITYPKGIMNSILPCLPFLNTCCQNGEACLAVISDLRLGPNVIVFHHHDLLDLARLLHPYVHQLFSYLQVSYFHLVSEGRETSLRCIPLVQS